MTVKPIGPVEPIPVSKRADRSEKVGGDSKTDSINISAKAAEQAEKYLVLELIKAAPETNEARIAELREKINDPNYINDKVIKETADNIVNAWFA